MPDSFEPQIDDNCSEAEARLLCIPGSDLMRSNEALMPSSATTADMTFITSASSCLPLLLSSTGSPPEDAPQTGIQPLPDGDEIAMDDQIEDWEQDVFDP